MTSKEAVQMADARDSHVNGSWRWEVKRGRRVSEGCWLLVVVGAVEEGLGMASVGLVLISMERFIEKRPSAGVNHLGYRAR